jgi:hypothetical protein
MHGVHLWLLTRCPCGELGHRQYSTEDRKACGLRCEWRRVETRGVFFFLNLAAVRVIQGTSEPRIPGT